MTQKLSAGYAKLIRQLRAAFETPLWPWLALGIHDSVVDP